MPAKSKAQHRLMALVLAYKRGKVPASDVDYRVKDIADAISMKDLEDFINTPTDNLPERLRKMRKEIIEQLEEMYMKKKTSNLREDNSGDSWIRYTKHHGNRNAIPFSQLASGKAFYFPTDADRTVYRVVNPSAGKYRGVGSAMEHYTSYRTDASAKVIPLSPDEVHKYIMGEGMKKNTIDKSTAPLKLKSLVEEKWLKTEQDENPPISKDEQNQYLEAIKGYGKYSKKVYRESTLEEMTKHIGSIVEFASRFTTEQAGDWFDGVTVSRHMKRMQESYKLFEKTAKEMTALQQRLEACYEDIGSTLGKYYDIEGGEEAQDTVQRNMQTEGVLTESTARPLYTIAQDIRRDWKNVNFGAKPYLSAMSGLDSIDDGYGEDSAYSIVAYFLSNATSWRGETAKQIKAELKSLMKTARRKY